MDYFLLAVTAFCCGGYYIVGGLYGRRGGRSDPFVYVLFQAAAVLLFFLAYNGFRFTWDGATLLLALFFGVCYLTCSACTLLAVKYGEVSLTSLLIQYSLLLPAFFGVIVYGDKTGVFFYAGIALLAASMLMINRKKPSEGTLKKKSALILWAAFAGAALLANGACMILQTYQQRLRSGGFKAEFMISAMVIVIIANIAVLIFRRDGLKEKIKRGVPFGAAARSIIFTGSGQSRVSALRHIFVP